MRVVTLAIFLTSLFLFLSVQLPPEKFAYTGLLPLLIPFFILINLFLLLILILSKRRLLVVPLVALIIGWKFVGITFQWNQKPEDSEGLSVLSYNTHLFNFHQSREEGQDQTKNAVQWVRDNPSEIK